MGMKKNGRGRPPLWKGQSTQLKVRIKNADYSMLEKLAEREERTISEMFRVCLRRGMEASATN